MTRNRLIVFLVIILVLLSLPFATSAQAGNLLNDPGFESTAVWPVFQSDQGSGTVFSVAPAWTGWVGGGGGESWQNVLPNGYPHSENGAGFTRSGNRSQEISRGSATFTAAVYQTVAVAEGTNVVGSAWARMNLDISVNPQAQARVGIDPNGGGNPFDSDVVWSPWVVNAINGFQQMTVEATATGTSVTIFLYATQALPADPNGVYWDDASLTVGGAGGVATGGTNAEGTPVTAVPANTPVPTAPPVVPFVQPQGARDDGSIVHVVVAGDTIDSIAVAYGSSRDEIVALNDLPSIRFLQIGQEILIRPPQQTTNAGSNADDDDDDVATEDDAAVEDDEPAATSTTRPTRTPRPTQTAQDDDTVSQQGADDDPVDEEPVDEETVDEEPADEEPVDEEPTDEEPTPDPTATDVPATPTTAPTAPVVAANNEQNVDPSAMLGTVCVTMFEDANMNRIQDQDELFLAEGNVALNLGADALDAVVTNATSDPMCFTDLESGDYVALATPPQGYGLTTSEQLRLTVQPGTTLNVAFGAAEGVMPVEPPPADVSDNLNQEVAQEVTVEDDDNLEQLLQISGLIVFGLAGLTLIGGLGAMLLLRRR